MSSMTPRGKDETDEQYKARLVALGKFNKKMYGKIPVMTPTRPTMLKEPMPPKTPPTEVPMRGVVLSPTGGKAPTKPMVKTPPTEVPMRDVVLSPTGGKAPTKPMVKTPPTEVPMRDVVFSPTGGKAPAKKLSPPGPPPRIPASVIAEYERTAAKLAEPTIVKKATTAEKLAAPTPMKKAAGGAAKVRKGMMSPEGKILHAMNKIRGK